MSSVTSPLPAAAAAAAPAAARRASLRFDGAAFRRVFNLRAVALAFWVVLCLVASTTLSWTWGQGLEKWFFLTGYMVRQHLVTAFAVLLAAALVEGWLPAAPVRRRLLAATLLILAASVAGAFIRMSIGRGNLTDDQWTAWFIGTVVLWTLLGGLGYWLYVLMREDEAARARLADARCEQERLATQATEAQLSALQAQIEPHFLFNTLATVKRLYETDAGRGREMMASLIAYFRAVLPSLRGGGSTLGSELDLARSYLTILKLRMGERLDFDVSAEPRLAAVPMPPMLLPTLVENAIKHGLTPLPEGGRVDVRAFERDGNLCVQVADTGAGFMASGGSGVGLANTRQRLHALYGCNGCLSLRANQPRGVVAEISLPLPKAA